MLYTINLYSNTCQLFHNKTGKKKVKYVHSKFRMPTIDMFNFQTIKGEINQTTTTNTTKIVN